MKHLSLKTAQALQYQRNSIPFIALVLVLTLITGCLSSGFAQKMGEVKISGITAQTLGSGTLVSIKADGPLSRAQMWQDAEGYHVVVPHAALLSGPTDNGVRVRRIGQSLEILVQTKPGARVTARPVENGLNLSVDGRLEPRSVSAENWERRSGSTQKAEERTDWPSAAGNTAATPAASDSAVASTSTSPVNQSPLSSNQPANDTVSYNQIVPQQDGTTVQNQAPLSVRNEEGGLIASIFSGTGVIIILLLGVIALLVAHKFNSREKPTMNRLPGKSHEQTMPADAISSKDANMSGRDISPDQGHSMVPANGAVQMGTSGQKANVQLPVAAPASLYGAYRIDQEVGKLVLGQPHRMDVLSSRAPDDRRAIEASLIKTMSSPQADEPVKRRAREALEEYGFVARQSAAMLMASDAFDRTLAARTLGEIQSPAALPFLLEALYDHEAIVRNQAVLSIGELRIPSAIGALLDMARKHPDVPGSLLSRALGACSLDGLDFFDVPSTPSGQSPWGSGDTVVHEIEQLEPPASVEELPESSDDEQFSEALAKLDDEEFEERSKAVKELGQFPVQVAVKRLAMTARRDPHPGIRSLAVGSLAAINHESVFPSVLIGMADESREVRAAAARALSRLGFSRADAYVRVLQTAEAEVLTDVAQACIQAGIVYQEIERLASTDRRQVYEAFSLLTLIARAELIEPIIEAISSHQNVAVRLAALRLLSSCATPGIVEKLRDLVSKDGLDEEVTTALLETLYKLDHAKTPDSQDSGDTTCQAEAEPTVEVGKAKPSSDEIPRHDPNVDEVDT